MRVTSISATTAVVALALVACGSSPPEDPLAPEETEVSASELRTRVLTEADDGASVTVTEGDDIAVVLASNPTTGFRWDVVDTDGELGLPIRRYVPGGFGIGAGGHETFTWRTRRPVSIAGVHKVELAYRRPWEGDVPPARTFSFTVEIVSDAPDCRVLGCRAGTRCIICWASYACVPTGALC